MEILTDPDTVIVSIVAAQVEEEPAEIEEEGEVEGEAGGEEQPASSEEE